MEQQGLHKEQAAEQGHSSCSSCPSADFRQTPTSFTGTSLLRAASYSVDTVRQIFRQQHARSEIAAQTHTSCTGTSLPDAASYSLRVMRSFLVVPLYRSSRGSLRATSCFSGARGAGVCRGPARADQNGEYPSSSAARAMRDILSCWLCVSERRGPAQGPSS